MPQPLADVVMTSLSRDVETRYQRAEDLGVAIGEACADSWGPEWLDHAGIAIVGSERLSRAARTTGHHVHTLAAAATGTLTPGARRHRHRRRRRDHRPRRRRRSPGAGDTTVTGKAGTAIPGAAETGVAGAPAAAPEGAHETMARPAAPPAGPPPRRPPAPCPPPRRPPRRPPPPSPRRPAAVPEFQVVRAAAAEPRIQGADIYELELADLIGVEDVLDPPKPPWPSILLMAVAFAAAVLVALFGLGEPDRSGTLEPGQVEVAGVDVVDGGRVEVDLSEDLTVTVTDPALAAQADEVELAMGPVGLPISTISGAVAVRPGRDRPGHHPAHHRRPRQRHHHAQRRRRGARRAGVRRRRHPDLVPHRALRRWVSSWCCSRWPTSSRA